MLPGQRAAGSKIARFHLAAVFFPHGVTLCADHNLTTVDIVL